MVNTIFFKKAMLISLISIAFSFSSKSQESMTYTKLGDYRKFSLMLGPSLYVPATSQVLSGISEMENLPILGISGGFEYDFRPHRQWSFVTGIIIAREPAYNLRLDIKKEDIYPSNSDLTLKMREAFVPAISIPFYTTYKLPLNKNQFLEFRSGLKVKFLPTSEVDYCALYADNTFGRREIFCLNMVSSDQIFYGSFLFGAGITSLFSRFLIKTNLIYTVNFQDTYRGIYEFKNMRASGPSNGTYALSGNHLSLMFNIAFLKPENRFNSDY